MIYSLINERRTGRRERAQVKQTENRVKMRLSVEMGRVRVRRTHSYVCYWQLPLSRLVNFTIFVLIYLNMHFFVVAQWHSQANKKTMWRKRKRFEKADEDEDEDGGRARELNANFPFFMRNEDARRVRSSSWEEISVWVCVSVFAWFNRVSASRVAFLV